MAVSSTRQISLGFSGDLIASLTYSAATNSASPGQIEVKALAAGPNTITPPAGVTPKAVTIVPPTGNVIALTIKGVAGDTGIVIHDTDFTTIALDSPSATFVIDAGNTVNVRLVWS